MNISDDRIKELREFVHSRTRDIDHFDPDGWNKRADLLSVLDDYSALKAENERLRIAKDGLRESLGICCAMGKEHKARAEKAEAALEKVCARNKLMDETFGSLLEKNINLEAELAKVAPLIEAAMGANEFGIHWTMEGKGWDDGVDAILREALKLREEKK